MMPGESSTEEVKRHHKSLKRARDKEEMESTYLVKCDASHRSGLSP